MLAQKDTSKPKYTCVPADMYNEWAFQLLERNIFASLVEVAHSKGLNRSGTLHVIDGSKNEAKTSEGRHTMP